jgi:iron complex transport system substrate-binding protein
MALGWRWPICPTSLVSPEPKARVASLSAPSALAAAVASLFMSFGVAADTVSQRVVSLNPSLTEMLIALDAAGSLVGVDSFSAQSQPEVKGLPTVGGLFNPSLEAVLALEPDLVVWVPGARQRDLAGRLRALGVEALELPNITLDQVLASLETLGRRVGRERAARTRIEEIRAAFRQVEQRTARRPAVRAVLVLQRDPLYVVGRGSFIDEMLRTAGGENAAASFDEPYPRVAVEWLIAAAPDVILDASEGGGDVAAHWSRWPSLPAVAQGRAVALPASVMRPGPYLDRSLEILASILAPRPASAEGARSEASLAEPSAVEGASAEGARSEASLAEPGAVEGASAEGARSEASLAEPSAVER